MMKIIRQFVNKHGYRVTMIDRRPFGMVTMRMLEPRNLLGRVDSFFRSIFEWLLEKVLK